MSWSERIFGHRTPEEALPQASLAHDLAALQGSLSANAHALTAHAALAPHESGARTLRRLAEHQQSLADEVRAILVGIGGPVPLFEAPPPGPPVELSYWARLCDDLSRHIEAYRRLVELAVAAEDISPALARHLQHIASEEAESIRQLRGLIARADPHAFN